MSELRFKDKIGIAAQEGLLIGTKWGIFLLIIGVVLYLMAIDYATIRQRSYNGQLAYEALVRAEQAQKMQTEAPKP